MSGSIGMLVFVETERERHFTADEREIADSLAAGESVKFPGLGTFEAHVSAPRVMRLNLLANPETRTVGGKRRARFRASSAFAAAVEFRKD